MSTNYYLHTNTCAHCDRADPPLHIGKSSVGWVFSLRVSRRLDDGYPISLEEWRTWWSEPGAVIRDEYNDFISPETMYKTITERAPGLYRHNLEAGYCASWGLGTFDLLTCEFS